MSTSATLVQRPLRLEDESAAWAALGASRHQLDDWLRARRGHIRRRWSPVG